jgi:hypothetical protein
MSSRQLSAVTTVLSLSRRPRARISSGVREAAGDVAAGSAPERGLGGLVGAVDREADPVEVGGVRGEQLASAARRC